MRLRGARMITLRKGLFRVCVLLSGLWCANAVTSLLVMLRDPSGEIRWLHFALFVVSPLILIPTMYALLRAVFAVILWVMSGFTSAPLPDRWVPGVCLTASMALAWTGLACLAVYMWTKEILVR